MNRKMSHKLLFTTCALLCLSICVSCEKEEKPVITPIDTAAIATDGLIGLDKIMPELITMELMKYDEHMGYYVCFPEQVLERSLVVESSYIPSQAIPCSFKATRTAIPESSGWDADDVRRIVLKDIVVSSFLDDSDLVQAECDGVFKMRLSLGENVPYRKVTLTDCEVAFSDWFRATAESSFSELEVTAEGTVISFRLDSIQDPDRFLDGYAQICYNLDVSFHAHATVSPEDYIGSVSEKPAELELCCDFEFDQIDFTTCGLHFEGPHSRYGRVSCMGVLPSPFPGEGSDITFTSPRIFLDYEDDAPFTSTRLNVEAFFDDDLTHPTVEFSLSDNGKYLFMPKDDGIDREGIKTVEIESMEKLDSGPFFGKYKQAMLIFQQDLSNEGTFRTDQEYKMRMAVEWWLPLAFIGTPNNISFETPRLELNGKKLNARRGYVHEFSQEIGGDLPFDCLITPVFTFGEHEPIYLDSFVLDKSTTKKVVYQFPTATDYWKATFHYLITVTKGKNEFFTKDYGLTTNNTVFTANLEKSQTVYTN